MVGLVGSRSSVRKELGKRSPELLWKSDRPARLSVNPDVFGCASCDQLLICFDAVGEGHAAAPQVFDPAGNQNTIPITGRRSIGKLSTGDQQEITLLFDSSVVESSFEAKPGAGKFEPDQIVGVVNNPHLVGFGVPHLDLYRCRALGFRSLHGPIHATASWRRRVLR